MFPVDSFPVFARTGNTVNRSAASLPYTHVYNLKVWGIRFAANVFKINMSSTHKYTLTRSEILTVLKPHSSRVFDLRLHFEAVCMCVLRCHANVTNYEQDHFTGPYLSWPHVIWLGLRHQRHNGPNLDPADLTLAKSSCVFYSWHLWKLNGFSQTEEWMVFSGSCFNVLEVYNACVCNIMGGKDKHIFIWLLSQRIADGKVFQLIKTTQPTEHSSLSQHDTVEFPCLWR